MKTLLKLCDFSDVPLVRMVPGLDRNRSWRPNTPFLVGFLRWLEQFQPYVFTVSHTVSGQYNGSCPPGYGGAYQPPCSSLMHVALAKLQIQGHGLVTYGYSGVYNQYLTATATDSLTPQETASCVSSGACPMVTTGDPTNAGEAGVDCEAMGWIYEDPTNTIGYFFAIAETLVKNLSGSTGYNCRKVSIWGTINCDFNTITSCTNATPYPGPKVVTDSPPGMGGWWSFGECVREGPSYPWMCSPLPYAALKTPQTGPATCSVY